MVVLLWLSLYFKKLLYNMIPPLLGFYSKLFVINALSYQNIYIAILAVIASVISCVKYLYLIQITSFSLPSLYYNNKPSSNKDADKNINISSNVISIITILISLSFIKPVYLLSNITYLLL